MAVIKHSVDINASRERVYKAVATEKGLSNWWTKDVTADAEVGGKADFRFEGAGFHAVMNITKLGPNAEVEWQCTDSVDEWIGSKFTFKIEERNRNSLLLFTQHYSKPISDEEYGRFNFNWGYYLHSLKEYCETGQGKPYGA
ncbi:SRPBCC domain-containing protein [candidate division KSB1 bacterium]|nr:SRPBCC domain-containing protein [candidate division KSB1 bacterium]NIT71366.1 SRPBCC domain-containing protein [candidate division KSB1 bacterium]NIX71046.1 SRPBCC domain-containing protein [candidate division KSB1 bacterium]